MARRGVNKLLYRAIQPLFSNHTLHMMRFDLIRLKARLKRYGQKDIMPSQRKLHFGCGMRHIQGWLNVDVTSSDYDVDLAAGRLPWKSEVFDVAVSQHFIEHLDLLHELMPLLSELRRVLRSGGEIWLSCPDIEKICRSYLEHNMLDLLADRKERFPHYSMEKIPPQYMINDLFYQSGEHKNLYDFKLLEWALTETSFTNVKRVAEADLLSRFPEFLPRYDDLQSIYIQAIRS